jgi:hypothetical protein
MDEAVNDTQSKDDPFSEMRAAKPWLDAIDAHTRSFSKYNDSADRIDRLYADLEKSAKPGGEREFQIFWSNLEVLKPSIYSRPPVPAVVSRFRDRRELPRHASEILQRALATSFEAEDLDATMRLVRDDLATNARGVVWLRYTDSDLGETVTYDHLDRKDFAHEVARKWKEVGWVARRSWLTREHGLKRFGDAWLEATLTVRNDRDRDDEPMTVEKAAVWEIWSKTDQAVVWVSPGMEEVLDIQPPFLSLQGFFPCPRPAYGTLERGSLKPVPDFVYYKDQVEEINELTARISALAEALRMKGFYSAGVEDLSDAIEAALKKTDNAAILVPVPNTAVLGGAALKDSIIWLPVAEIAQVITQLIALRRQLIEDVYQITGLSDIMRGATNPNETLGAQQLKSQYGSVRVRDRQFELVRVARDITRMAGEIIAENFQPQSIIAMSQYEALPQKAQIDQQIKSIKDKIQAAAANPENLLQVQQNPKAMQQAEQLLQQAQAEIEKLEKTVTLEQVFAFLRNERIRPFVLDIETDSTIQPDENAAKGAMSEFLGALAQALGQLGPMVAGQPETAPLAADILKMAVSPFRAGRQLEATIDAFAENMKRKAGQPRPNPEQEKLKAESEKSKAELEFRINETAARNEIEKAKLNMEREKTHDQMKLERLKVVASADGPEIEALANQTEVERMQVDAVLEELRKGREQQGQIMTLLTQALMAPKRVIRDEKGSPIGVEPVTDRMPLQ